MFILSFWQSPCVAQRGAQHEIELAIRTAQLVFRPATQLGQDLGSVRSKNDSLAIGPFSR